VSLTAIRRGIDVASDLSSVAVLWLTEPQRIKTGIDINQRAIRSQTTQGYRLDRFLPQSSSASRLTAGAAVLYLVTIPFVWWRDDYCSSLPKHNLANACKDQLTRSI
jgi:hypothetical protein